jgi:hypothetical protein
MKPLILAVLLPLLSASSALAAETRTFSMSVTVPTAAYKLRIVRVYKNGKTPVVVAKLTPPEGFAAEVISKAKDKVSVSAPAGAPQYVVLGKTWNWENDEPYSFPSESPDEWFKAADARKDLKLLWTAPEVKEKPKAERPMPDIPDAPLH